MTRFETSYSALVRRTASNPTAPLFTDVDLAADTRVELSAESALNGAAKAAHLVSSVAAELGRPPVVRLDLPLHWQAATFTLGCWAAGAHRDLRVSGRECPGPGRPRRWY